MKQLRFSVEIPAPKEKVWRVLLEDPTYRIWTSVFGEGSHAVGDWQEGSKMLFLGANGMGGMSSRIFRHVPNAFLSIQHLGVIVNGVEDFDSEATKRWSGALENYSLNERKGVSELIIEIDVTEEYIAYFEKTWPLALEKVKTLSETE